TVSADAVEQLKNRMPQLQQVEIRSAALLGVQGDHLGGNAHVNGVMPGSAAEKAGIKVGDIITKLDDEKVEDFKGLTELIATQQPGETVTLTIIRQGKAMKLDVTFSKWGTDAIQFRNQQRVNVPVQRLQQGTPRKILLDR